LDVHPDYIDVTVDNASTITFSVAAATRFLVIAVQSGGNYTQTPTCPTNSVTLNGTGAQAILRLTVKTTNTCPAVGGGGGGGGYMPPLPVILTVSVLNVPANGVVADATYLTNPTTGARILIPAGTKVTNADGSLFSGNLTYPEAISGSNLSAPLPAGLNYENAIVISSFGGLSFDKEPTVTIPLPAGTDLATVKIYWYNPETLKYELVGDGGTVSADGKSISVKTNLVTIFVAADEKSNLPLTPSGFFTDISSHWAESFITKLYTSCSVDGYKDASGNPLHLFLPDTQITRAELTKIVAQCKFGDTLVAPTVNSFPDVPASHFAAAAIAKAQELGWVKGYSDGTFHPNQLINRAEALKIILLSTFSEGEIVGMGGGDVSMFTDIDATAWYSDYVAYGVSKGFISGYKNADGTPNGLFGPGKNITRAETAKITVNTLGL
jgi:hypothetical protein